MLPPPQTDETPVAKTNPAAAGVPRAHEESPEAVAKSNEPTTPADEPIRDGKEIISGNSTPPTIPDDGVIKPWDDPFVDATSWDDQLDGVLQHVEQSLKGLETDK